MKKETRNHKKKLSPGAGVSKEGPKQKYFPVNHKAGMVVGLLAFLLYSNTINFGYVLDDAAAIVENQFVKNGMEGIPDILRTDFWHFSNLKLGYYRPLAMITFALEHEIFNGNPVVSHLFNVLLFALSGYLLFIVLSKLFRNKNFFLPFAISLIFIAHPIHTEVVANIKSRDEILSFLNVMLTLWFSMKFFDTKKIIHLLLSLLFFYLALLSKETAMAGMFLVPVVLFFRSNLSIPRALITGIPYLLMIGLFLLQKKLMLGTLTGMAPDDLVNYPYTDSEIKVPTTFLLFAFSIKLLFIPHPLRYDYSYNQIPGVDLSNWGAMVGLVLFISGISAIVSLYRSKSPIVLGLIILYITLLPSLAFTILRGGIFAERFLYFPSLGFCIFLVAVIALLLKTNFNERVVNIKKLFASNIGFSIILLLVFMLYSIKTMTRNMAWKDEMSLFSTDIKTGGNSTQNLRHYGTEILKKAVREKDPNQKRAYATQAIGIFKQAIRIYPKFSEAYNQIGTLFQEVFLVPDSAIYYYNKSIEASPGLAFPYYNLGTIYQITGNEAAASFYYNEAIKMNPTYQNAINAKKNLKDATGLDVQVNPLTTTIDTTTQIKNALYYYNLGNFYASRGDYASAAQSFQQSVTMDATHVDSYINLANSYGMLKEYQKSIEVSEQLLKIDPNNKRGLENLAHTYRLMGNEVKANEYLRRANNPGK